MKPLLLALSLLLWVNLQGQQKEIDSLQVLLEKATTDSIQYELLTDIGNYYLNLNLDSAYLFFGKAIAVAERMNSAQRKVKSLANQGVAKYHQEKFEEALRILLDAYEQSQNLTDRQNHQSKIINNLALIYHDRAEFEKAEEFYRKAFILDFQLKDSISAGKAMVNLGMLKVDIEQRDSAVIYTERALEVFKATKAYLYQAAIYNNLGHIISESDEPKSLEYFLQAYEMGKTYNKSTQMLAAINIGETYKSSNRANQAIPFYEESLQLAEEFGSMLYVAENNRGLAESYAELGDFEKAYEYHQIYQAKNDSLLQELNSENMAEMQTQFDTKETEAKLIARELELERQQGIRNRIILGGITLILALLGLFQYFRYRNRIKRQENELALQLEKAEAEKLREMDQLKSNFFANISHEFRTPLTLILSPLDQMINGSFKGNRDKYFKIMHRNGKRLLGLVNQLLDLSRLESGKMALQQKEGNLSNFLRAIAYSFESLADRKQIDYTVDIPEQPVFTSFDRDKLEKIVANLLSNAFKFTPEENSIEVKADFTERGGKWACRLEVNDTGIGIPADQLPHIFDRFYSVSESELETGSSGIGLALTKELIMLHGGDIQVDSKEGKGSKFVVNLQLQKLESLTEEQLEADTKEVSIGDQPVLRSPVAIPNTPANQKPLLLIVEDNEDVRNFIKDELKEYRLVEAENGKIGLEKAQAEIPDLIISDVMMPEMNGIELCNALKKDQRTSHIPVIMLTAKAEQEDKLEGLETGADDYLIKPFDARELKVRIANLIKQRALLREVYQSNSAFQPKSIAVTSVDEQFLEDVKAAIEKNMDEESFSVVELSSIVGMSRSQLHRKLKALTDRSPNQIIRDMRLLRAKELLEKGAGNASEVAFMVGFNSLAYFSKCFSDAFGQSPSELKPS